MNRSRTRSDRSVWWLHPSWLFATINLVLALVAICLPQAQYELWGTSKYFGYLHLTLICGAVGCFCIASGIAARLDGNVRIELSDQWVAWAFQLSAFLTITAYALWFVTAISNGLSISHLVEVLSGTRGATRQLKDIFVSFPGITTFTQAGIAACVLFSTLRQKTPASRILLLSILGLGLVRAVLLAERLAFIELCVALLFVPMYRAMVAYRTKHPWIAATGLPAALVVGLIVFFGVTEYFRSWQFYKTIFQSFPEFIIWRISSYYVTALNNGAMYVNLLSEWPAPYFSLQWFWEFPLVKMSPGSYESLFDVRPDDLKSESLRYFASPELTNTSGILAQMVDFGWLGYGVFWLTMGAICGCCFASFRNGNVVGRLLMPILIVGILESPRVPYFTSTRVIPAFAVLAFTVLLGAKLVVRFNAPAKICWRERSPQQRLAP